MITVVDSQTKIAEAATVVEEMMGDGLIAISDVESVRLVHAQAKETAR